MHNMNKDFKSANCREVIQLKDGLKIKPMLDGETKASYFAH